ncbi:hypothetical protein JCM3774_004197 [Rhodotorula dairenensis]
MSEEDWFALGDANGVQGPESVFAWADRLLKQYPPGLTNPPLARSPLRTGFGYSDVQAAEAAASGAEYARAVRPLVYASIPPKTASVHSQEVDLVSPNVVQPPFLFSAASDHSTLVSRAFNNSTRGDLVLSDVASGHALAASLLPRSDRSIKEYRLPSHIVGPGAAGPMIEGLSSYDEWPDSDRACSAVSRLPVSRPICVEKVQPLANDNCTIVRTQFPAFPSVATALGPAQVCEREPETGSSFRAAYAGLTRSGSTAPYPAHPPSYSAEHDTDGKVPFFGPWNNGGVELLDLGQLRVSIAATISDPPNFSYDLNVGSWVAYRRSHISLDIFFGVSASLRLPDATAGYFSQLHTTSSAVPIERFEVEVTSWSSPSGKQVDLKQFDKTRVLGRATPLGRQVLRPETGKKPQGVAALCLPAPDARVQQAADTRSVLTTRFRRVHYAHATPNRPRRENHQPVHEGAYIMRVSVLAIHMDGSESTLGAWTSAPHLVRGRSRAQFQPADNSTPTRGRHSRTKSSEFIEDSDVKAEACT